MNVVNVGVQERLMKENYKWYEIIENHKTAAVTGVTGELTTYGCSFLWNVCMTCLMCLWGLHLCLIIGRMPLLFRYTKRKAVRWCKNYRENNLLSVPRKVLSRILIKRIMNKICQVQCSFMLGKGSVFSSSAGNLTNTGI